MGWTKSESILNLFVSHYLGKQEWDDNPIYIHKTQTRDDLYNVLKSYVDDEYRPHINQEVVIDDHKIVFVYDHEGSPIGISTNIGVRSFEHAKNRMEYVYTNTKKEFLGTAAIILTHAHFMKQEIFELFVDTLSSLSDMNMQNFELDYVKYILSTSGTYHIGSLLKEV